MAKSFGDTLVECQQLMVMSRNMKAANIINLRVIDFLPQDLLPNVTKELNEAIAPILTKYSQVLEIRSREKMTDNLSRKD